MAVLLCYPFKGSSFKKKKKKKARTLQMLDNASKAVAMGCNQDPFPLLDLGDDFFIPEGQCSGNSVLQTLTGG
jgi:hypothetical protein